MVWSFHCRGILPPWLGFFLSLRYSECDVFPNFILRKLMTGTYFIWWPCILHILQLHWKCLSALDVSWWQIECVYVCVCAHLWVCRSNICMCVYVCVCMCICVCRAGGGNWVILTRPPFNGVIYSVAKWITCPPGTIPVDSRFPLADTTPLACSYPLHNNPTVENYLHEAGLVGHATSGKAYTDSQGSAIANLCTHKR